MSAIVDRGHITPALEACQHLDLDALFSEQVGWFSRCTDCLAEFDEDGELLR